EWRSFCLRASAASLEPLAGPPFPPALALWCVAGSRFASDTFAVTWAEVLVDAAASSGLGPPALTMPLQPTTRITARTPRVSAGRATRSHFSDIRGSLALPL